MKALLFIKLSHSVRLFFFKVIYSCGMENEKYLTEAFEFLALITPKKNIGIEKMTSLFGERRVLHYLSFKEEALSSGKLCEELDIKTSRMAAILKSLEKKEWILRSHPSFDKRITEVSLTEQGRESVKKDKEIVTSIVKKIHEEIGEEEMSKFKEIVKKICCLLEDFQTC